jgi:TonB family protein
VVLFSLLATCATSPGRGAEAIAIDASFDVQLDASGAVQSVEPVGKAAEMMATPIGREIRKWSFEPGNIGGRPARTRTTVHVSTLAYPSGGDYALRILGAQTGPRYGASPPPQYPKDAVKAHEQGSVELLVDIDAGGQVSKVSVHRSNASHRLEEAAIAAVSRWRFVTETVGGFGVAASALVPINFCTARPCEGLPPQSDGQAMADARLLSAPAARIVDRGPVD